MTNESTSSVAVIVPNWNGKDDLPACLDSLLNQSMKAEIIVVENGSTDGSAELISSLYPSVVLLKQAKNLGFAGGVNVGIRYAIDYNYEYVALFNNDAVADKDWLQNLVFALSENEQAGIATCKFIASDKILLDSTAELYSTWGLPYPRGRKEKDGRQYDQNIDIFGATGGATLYRSTLLKEIGLFDEDFFAYYEDVDISWRAQLAGWKVTYTPSAIAYHVIGATSSKIKGFSTYQTIKNLPWIVWKNVPLKFLPIVLPRFTLAYWLFIGRAIVRGHGWYAIKGTFVSTAKLPKKLIERRHIQENRTVSNEYIASILTWDLPPNATNLRTLRAKWRKLTNRKANT